MCWEETISLKVTGITRSELIHSFRKWKGERYIPAIMHSALQWDNQDPFPLEEVQLESPFEILTSDYKVDKKALTDEFPNKKSDHLHGIVQAQGS